MNKIVDLCGICAGNGKFLMRECPSCKGTGGTIFKPNKEAIELVEQNKSNLSEQEVQVWDLYKGGFSQKEIAEKMNLTIAMVASIFYKIQKKLNQS
ncbi:MAG: hypothetical protein ABIA97_04740 [Candidatus Omnitrophota bacterium]